MTPAWLMLIAPLAGDDFARNLVPILEANCTDCHAGEDPEGELDLSRFRTADDARGAPAVFTRVLERVRGGEMPPGSLGPLDGDARARLVAWIEANVEPPARPEPIHLGRLNRDEYRRSVLDLFGVDVPVDEWLPPDGFGHGFDTMAGAQSISPSFLEAALHAAEEIAGQAIVDPDDHEPSVVRVRSGEMETPGAVQKRDGLAIVPARNRAIARVAAEAYGTYRVSVRAAVSRPSDVRAFLRFSFDGRSHERVEAHSAEETELETTIVLTAGVHTVGLHFDVEGRTGDEEAPAPELRVRELVLRGPLEPPPPPRFQRELQERFPDPAEAVRSLARRAWRRPVSEEETRRLLALSTEEDDWNERVRTAIVALLASPHFLLRAEGAHDASFALASRLSFFLWSSTPDDRLLQLASLGLLERALSSEVRRMLADPRSSALAERFAEQWLQLDRLDQHAPDPRRFPGVDAELVDAMRQESRLFFEAVLREGRPVRELLSADFTFVNGRLASHYGIPGVHGASFRRVRIPEGLREQRGGLLGQASVLTATSNPTRTSPVLRGKWLLEVVLGTPTPPPPPGVGDLPDDAAASSAASLRERLERHRSDPSCAVCHDSMDGLGFGLENYDAVGAWRTRDGAFALDTRGEVPGGEPFDGPHALRERLASAPGLPLALGRSLAHYALGRTLSPQEQDEIEARVAALEDPSIADLVEAVCTSEAFRATGDGAPYHGGER